MKRFLALIAFKTGTSAAVCLAVLLVLVPFFAPLTIWPASQVGHYTLFRLWDEVLILIASLMALWLVWRQKVRLSNHWLVRWLAGLSLLYVILEIALGAVALMRHEVNLSALGQGLILNLRLIVLFWLGAVVNYRHDWLGRYWRPLLLAPAAVVVVFGLLQAWVLPHDFLRHLGYSAATILPYETINNNQHYVRVMSTLRGANPLGAYLVVIVAVLSVLFLRAQNFKARSFYGLFEVAAIVVLGYSFSRSAWIGAGLSVLSVLFAGLRSVRARRWSLAGAVIVVVLSGSAVYATRHNPRFENIFLHTQTHSSSSKSSDQGHVSALAGGLKEVLHQPLGDGPGTAGPASVHNNHPARIAENYFVQVAQEIGVIGLVVFGLLYVLIGRILWQRRQDPLSLALLASLVGLTFVNLLSHAWTDDTLAVVWWTLAGAVCSAGILRSDDDIKHVAPRP